MFKVLRYLLFPFGMFMGIPLILLLSLVPKTPISQVGVIYLVSYLTIVAGMVCAPWWSGGSMKLMLIGIVVAVSLIAFRLVSSPSGSQLKLISLPNQSGPRVLNRILNEQDAVLFGAQVGPHMGVITPAEEKSLISTFSRTFDEMYQNGATPLSPFLTTYLNLQGPKKFDVVLAEPQSVTQPQRGIIFLHGYGGNFTVQCWLIAKAGFRMDAVTVCPSTSVNGHWWNSQGEAILQETIAYLHQRGIKRIYLAGLSNGAIGSSRLAEHHESDLAGLILISGADPDATITGLPVLVIHGKNDERISVALMEQYVAAAGTHVTYHPFEGDHFLLLKQADQVQEEIVNWLTEQETQQPKP